MSFESPYSIIYYRQAQAQYFRDSGEIPDFFPIEIQSQQGRRAARPHFYPIKIGVWGTFTF